MSETHVERLRAMNETLIERLNRCIGIVGSMCSERRPPAMSIPGRRGIDEDFVLCDTMREAADELERLETIVAKLKLCDRCVEVDNMSRDDLLEIVKRLPLTADGVVVVPGMELWSMVGREHERRLGLGWADMRDVDDPVVHGDTDGYAPHDFQDSYSTREALEAALAAHRDGGGE